MPITIAWNSYDSSAVAAPTIYRSDTEETVFDTGNSIGQLPMPNGNYVDIPPEKDKVYYYGLLTPTNLGPMKSKIIAVADMTDSAGPGGIDVLMGTSDFGLISYDSSLASGLITGLDYLKSKIANQADIQTRAAVMRGTSPVTLVKFIRNGKTVLIPNSYQNYLVCTTAAKRAEINTFLMDNYVNGPEMDLMGFRVKIDLMTEQEYYELHAGMSASGGVPSLMSPWMVSVPEDTVGCVMFRNGTTIKYGQFVNNAIVITDATTLGASAGVANNFIGWVFRPVKR